MCPYRKNLKMKKPLKLLYISVLSIIPFLVTAQIITVNGPMPPQEMGRTLIHEHIMVDWIGADSTGYHRWNRDAIVERALPYLVELKQYGVSSFIDCTPAYLGRDPYVLKTLSERSGIHILTNTGYYGARENQFIPERLRSATPVQMAEHWIKEYENGIDSSGIRPGFIKISVDNQDILSEIHEKLIRAAALTHLKTGMTIVSHTGTDGPAMAQLKILKEMGVSPKAFVWTHAQNGTMEGYLNAAAEGAWISLDHVNGQSTDGAGNINWYIETLSELKSKGVLDHVLISHDAGWYTVGETNGGDFRGYTDLFTMLLPKLKANGFSQEDIDLLVKENPAKAYAIQIRKE